MINVYSRATSLDDLQVSPPAPLPIGVPIYPIVLQYLDKINLDKHTKDITRKLLQDRYQFGMSKYGQPLMSEDRRNDVEDCLQELGDAIQYVVKAKHNKKDLTLIKLVLTALQQITNSE